MSPSDGLDITAWHTGADHFEIYSYPPGPRGREVAHVHEDVQLCLSLNFPGRYRSGRWTCEVPAGAVSVVDAWEPHLAEDPCDRTVRAVYWMLYVQRERWDGFATALGAAPRLGVRVYHRAPLARSLALLHRRAHSGATALEQDERLAELLSALTLATDQPGKSSARAPRVCAVRLERARDYLRAHALEGVSLSEVARVCGASSQHLSAGFRARFGVPIHRFQILMRLDHARRLLAQGMSVSDAAAACGLADQSHLTRHFKRYLGTTPGRYRPNLVDRRSGS